MKRRAFLGFMGGAAAAPLALPQVDIERDTEHMVAWSMSGGLHVAVTDYGRVLTSLDGVTWKERLG